ncbi:probable methyltransferase TARBP1 [Megalops cyprinoides]|uniref:probable methyltransferase TARBP1 n=1 Tax=Megalops cyprinoides TaxID=118141 RepID=UPI0018649A4C|nr:probable methyltransferase TARBP1 [Megalops cyprinoides]
MSAILINALLLNCPDHENVLNTLCLTTDTWPETEKVEALATLIARIGKLPEYGMNSNGSELEVSTATNAKRERFLSKVGVVIWNQCLPLLFRISSENESLCNQSSQTKEMLSALCELLGVCVGLCDREVLDRLISIILPVLNLTEGETVEGKERLDAEVAIEALAVVVPALPLDKQLIARILSSALTCIRVRSDALVSKTVVRVLFTVLNNCGDCERRSDALRHIWENLRCWHESEGTPTVTARVLLCLTALSDHLYTPGKPFCLPTGGVDLRHSSQFWRIIQEGLTHRDNLSRKRALFLLKRCVAMSEEEKPGLFASPETGNVFRWVPERSQLLREFWEDYALIMETLDENQIHVVRPVLKRINALIEATVSSSEDSALLHPSWLQCVYQRMFHSENKTVMREGVCHLLELQVLRCPAFALAFSQFIMGPFLEVLAESSLFHRSAGQGIGECPEMGTKLKDFTVTFFTGLPQENRGTVLLQLLQRMGSRHWGAVPILFLSQALSCLPPCPVLGPQGLLAFREVLRSTMITHQVLLRGAAQCFLLQSAICLTDVSTVTLADVFGFLVHFPAEESLCRGTVLWNQLCDWLLVNEGSFKPAVRDRDSHLQPGANDTSPALEFVHCQLEAFLRVPASTAIPDSIPDPGEAELLARAILLSVDMEGRRLGGKLAGVLETLLLPLLDTLSRLSTNVYLPLRKTDKSLQLLLRLLQLRHRRASQSTQTHTGDGVAAALETSVLGVAEPIQGFLLRRLSGELCELCDVDRAGLYLSVLRELVQLYSVVGWHRTSRLGGFVPALTQNCLRVLQKPAEKNPSVCGQVARVVSMASLALLCEVGERHGRDLHPAAAQALSSVGTLLFPSPSSSSSSSPAQLNQTLHKPAVTTGHLEGGVEEGPDLRGWGRVAAQFVRDQWTCVRFVLGSHVPSGPSEAPPAIATLRAAMEALAILPSDLVLPVLDCMTSLLPQVVLSEEALSAEALTLAWKVVLGLNSNPHDFWPALEGFVRFAFDRAVLELTDTETPRLSATVRQVTSELLELSQVKTGVFHVLIRHCCHTWLPSDPGSESQADIRFLGALKHVDILAEACVYGPVFRRDQRLIQEVHMYVEQLGEECAANAAVTSDGRDEQFPRLCAVAFLSRLEVSRPLHERLMEELVLLLLRKDEEISKSKVRYYGNSLQHRVKNRVWQTLLVLLPKLREEFVETVLDRVYKAGFSSNQASVKYLIEWVIVLILHRHPARVDSLWACFSMDQEKTKTSICTFLSVLVHLNIILPNVKDKAGQWQKALNVVLQWCFSHNFSVRLYALLALKRVWCLEGARALAEEKAGGPDGLGGLAAVIQACLQQAEAMQSTGNAMKNWTRIQEHFFFGAFHPLEDYSIETIFHTFPSLSELADDEWIPPWKFERLVEFPLSSALPLQNPGKDLSQLQPGDWIQQDKGEEEQAERWAEVQKKMTPWRLGIHEQDPELQLVPQQRAARLGKTHSALLVVASLIDKPTNLGGLCRTCEIFGASALVLDSLRHVSDKHFQALSVSAELWLPLLEVKPSELTDFLQLKKQEGYCIVGVEQTANSQSLQGYRFPEKSLLLLGNEREGIPANLLQLLDVCVEIPQLGVTRSLNVHVSAALLVWEYTRQHLIPCPPAP